MNPTVKAAVHSAARHIATGGGGSGFVMAAGEGPTFLGLTAGQWQSLAIFVAGLVAAILDKLPERQP